MLAVLGFAVQAWVTGKGPIDNAIDHLKDPWGQNGKLPTQIACSQLIVPA